MGNDDFRKQQLEEFDSISQLSKYPLVGSEDPVFYSQESLLPYCGSGESRDSDSISEMSSHNDFAWSDETFPSTLPSDFLQNDDFQLHNDFQFEQYWHSTPDMLVTPSVSPGPIKVMKNEETSQRQVYSPYTRDTASVKSTTSSHQPTQTIRRGRPCKATSTSKMANYARNYRETKKVQLAQYEAEVKDLREENDQLRDENRRLQESFARLHKEIGSLRRVLNQDSKIASVVSSFTSDSKKMSLPSTDVGVCLHLGQGRMTVEVCDRCNTNSNNQKKNIENDYETASYSHPIY